MTKLERFSAGESFAVDPDAIERELASLWREAGRSTQEGGQPVTRACLWNVVVHLEEREGHEGYSDAARLEAMVGALPRHLAARALVLRTRPEAEGQLALESWISANCILAEGGGKLVCSEEITIASRGEAERKLPSLVRALLVPAVPTAVLFSGLPELERPAIQSLVELADRVVTDVGRSRLQAPVRRLKAAQLHAPLAGMDLGWLRMSGLRSAISSLFDPPCPIGDPGRIKEVRLVCPDPQAGLLLLGWIASALSAKAPVAQGPGRWRLSRPQGALELSLEDARDARDAHDAHDAHDGWTRVDFIAEGAPPLWARAHPDGIMELPDLAQPEAELQRRSLRAPQDVELLAKALATRAEDPPFERALHIAEVL